MWGPVDLLRQFAVIWGWLVFKDASITLQIKYYIEYTWQCVPLMCEDLVASASWEKFYHSSYVAYC